MILFSHVVVPSIMHERPLSQNLKVQSPLALLGCLDVTSLKGFVCMPLLADIIIYYLFVFEAI